MAGIQAVGFMEKDKKGWKRGLGGVQGFIEWLALHEPKTAAALFARVLPYFTNIGMEVPEVIRDRDGGAAQGAGSAGQTDRAHADSIGTTRP